MRTILNDLFVLVIIAALACSIGFAIDRFRGEPTGLDYRTPAQRLKISAQHGPAASTFSHNDQSAQITWEIEIITLDHLQQLIGKNQVMTIDVRPNIFFRVGHIPGSFSLQEKEFKADLDSVKPLLENALDSGKKIVVYCSGTHCSDASMVARKLAELGYGNLMILEGGWDAWQKAGLEEEHETL